MIKSIPNTTDTIGLVGGACPISRLEHDSYEKYEDLSSDIQLLLKQGLFRQKLEELPTFHCALLRNDFEWQRASVLLTMLSHAYVHGNYTVDKPCMVLPDNIAEAWILVSNHFGYEPVLNYASTVQFNWSSYSKDITSLQLEDLIINSTMTGTMTEVWFYQISLAIELESVRIIPIFKKLYHAFSGSDSSDPTTVISTLLVDLLKSLKTVGALLERLPEKCDPYIFFNQVRVYLAGWDTPSFKETGGLKFGTSPTAPIFNSTGGSAAQSPILQAVDALFDINHPTNPDGSPNYLLLIRKAMPISHRELILWVESWGCEFKRFCVEKRIIQPFIDCIMQLIDNRRSHAGVVWKYIKAEATKLDKHQNAVGTGGTSYKKFLSSIIANTQASLNDFQNQLSRPENN